MFEGLERVSYLPGQEIFKQGEVGDCAFLIETGSVQVSTLWGNMFHRICVLSRGELFGEVALIDSKPRTATVTALEDTEVVCIPRDLIESKLAREDPVIEHLLRLILKRFRYTHYRLTGADRFTMDEETGLRDDALTRSQENLIKHIELAAGINEALRNGDFQLYYQPVISISDNRVAGFEALIRWNHRERGLLSPMEFLNFAEETDQIIAIGTWTLEQVCEDLGRFAERHTGGDPDPSFFISLNLSPRQLAKAEDAAQLLSILDKANVEPCNIKLELTETVLIEEPEAAQQILTSLHELGFQISLDDFGTGYSSLSFLNKFPVNEIKVDQSFVQSAVTDQNSRQIVRASIDLAAALSINVVAEGVETLETLKTLEDMNCEHVQGYYFAQPMPLEAALEFSLKSGK